MKRLTAKEEEIMRIFWKEDATFVHELLKCYDEPKPHYDTVSTIVRGLEEKGFAGYKAHGNAYQCSVLISEKQYKRSALHEVVSQYYDNSYTNVVSIFIEEEGLSIEDLKVLTRQIEQGHKKQSYGNFLILPTQVSFLPDIILCVLPDVAEPQHFLSL